MLMIIIIVHFCLTSRFVEQTVIPLSVLAVRGNPSVFIFVFNKGIFNDGSRPYER